MGFNIYGTWIVTTEGDVEGRSTTNLGTFTGYVDEIALYLADKACYSLSFARTVDPNAIKYKPSRQEVNVTFRDSKELGYGVTDDVRVQRMVELFKDRPVTIANNNYYASAKIISNEKVLTKQERRKIALSKLSSDEIDLLGLNE